MARVLLGEHPPCDDAGGVRLGMELAGCKCVPEAEIGVSRIIPIPCTIIRAPTFEPPELNVMELAWIRS